MNLDLTPPNVILTCNHFNHFQPLNLLKFDSAPKGSGIKNLNSKNIRIEFGSEAPV